MFVMKRLFAEQHVLAHKLLKSQTERIPSDVVDAIEFLCGLGVAFKLSRNEPATSCQDAALKRNRDGKTGIPLADELKSMFGAYKDTEGVERPFLVHCRGHQWLDFQKLKRALGARKRPRRLSLTELSKLDLEVGLVNPFEPWNFEPSASPFRLDLKLIAQGVEQLFDQSLLQQFGKSSTVMTNAGDLTWAVEFDPREFIAKLPGAKVVAVVDNDRPGPSAGV